MAEKFDFKKEYKDLYLPKTEPALVTVRAMPFLMADGAGDPNTSEAYQEALELLYGFSFTIKMSPKTGKEPPGYFDYVVPPLEGLWWQEGITGVDYSRKDSFQWISLIRLPDFVKKPDFDWALEESAKKKKTDFSSVEFFTYEEGLCVQCMHLGSYDEEPATVLAMEQYAKENGYAIDITDKRHHHEIYLSDPRKTEVSKLKTVIRHPIRKI